MYCYYYCMSNSIKVFSYWYLRCWHFLFDPLNPLLQLPILFSSHGVGMAPVSSCWRVTSLAASGFRILVKTYGARAGPKGKHLNWCVFSLKVNLRKALFSWCIDTMKYASFRSTFAIQSPALSRSLSTWMPSILKCSMWTNLFRLLGSLLISDLHPSLVPGRWWTGSHVLWVWSLLWHFYLSCSGSPSARFSSFEVS